MALATRCPHCHTTFRVASDQLKLRGGIVRCGACQRIFDGSAHLVDLQAQAPAPAPAAPPPAEDPVYTVDLSHTFDPLGILPEPEPSPPPPGPPEPEHERDSHPVSSQPMQAPAAPFAPGRPQVWRTASRPQTEDEHAAYAGDVQPDPAATAVAEAPPPTASLAPEQMPAAAAAAGTDADAAGPTYAPADRVEPHLEPLYEPLQDVVTQPAAALESAPEPESAQVPEQGLEDEPQAPPAPVPESAPVHGYEPTNRIEPSFGLPVDEELVAQALPDDEHAPEAEAEAEPEAGLTPAPAPLPPPLPDIPPAALPLRASAVDDAPAVAVATPAPPRSARGKAVEARTRRSRLTPTKIEPPRLRVPHDDVDEPEFVKRSRRQERSGKLRRILLGAGSAVLLLALLAQAVTTWRNVLAARSPALKPALEAACALLGCHVALPAQVDNLAIETGELATLGPGTYSLHTLLRNQGNLVQAWPSIELELTDDDNKPVLRRVFAPAEYLPRGTAAEAGFAALSEQPVRLHFALSDVTPSDYHLFVFYP